MGWPGELYCAGNALGLSALIQFTTLLNHYRITSCAAPFGVKNFLPG